MRLHVFWGWLNLQDLEFEGPENFKARNLKNWILADQIARVDFDGQIAGVDFDGPWMWYEQQQ